MGGGGPQSLWGAQHYAWLAAQRGSGGSSSGSGGSSALSVALSAGVGADFPSHCQGWLEALGVETCGVVEVGGAETPRAWQLTEADGRRTQVWRVRADEAWLHGRPRGSVTFITFCERVATTYIAVRHCSLHRQRAR